MLMIGNGVDLVTHYARKVLAYAAEKGIESTSSQTAFPMHSQEIFWRPARSEDAGFSGWRLFARDSSAVVHYLEAKFPQPALIPTTPSCAAKPFGLRNSRTPS